MRSIGVIPMILAIAGLFLVTVTGGSAQQIQVERSTDSAGVEVVIVRGGLETYGPIGSVASEPELDIISMDPDDPWSFFGSVSAVRGFDDGSFVVADGQSATLYFFRPDGTVFGNAGGSGDAPGRFRAISSIPTVSGDSLWVWDAPAGRVTVYTQDGWVAGTTDILAMSGLTSVHPLPDRSFLGVARARAMTGTLGAGGQLAQRDTVRLSRVETDGRISGEVLALPGEEWLRIQYAAAGDFMMSATAQLPLGRNAAFAVLPEGIVGGPNDLFEVSLWDHDGRLLRTSHFPDLDEALTPERVAELREMWIEDAEGMVERIEHIDRVFAEGLAPDMRPAFRRVLADMEGRVWIQENDPWSRDRPRWWMFDQESGVLVGYVDFPAQFEVHEIGPDFVLGVHRDMTELPHVRRYALDLQLP